MKKVIVIEDNESVRENTKEILELAGYMVSSATDGKQGVAMVASEMPDLILCDIMMPVMDGFGVLLELNKNISTAGIPFVFLTAQSEILDKRKGLNLGADDYILKPFDDELLLTIVEARIKKSEQAREKLKQERLNYILELEEMLHITSHKLRKPICSFLGVVHLIDSEAQLNKEEVKRILISSKECALELDELTKELTLFLEKSRKNKNLN